MRTENSVNSFLFVRLLGRRSSIAAAASAAAHFPSQKTQTYASTNCETEPHFLTHLMTAKMCFLLSKSLLFKFFISIIFVFYFNFFILFTIESRKKHKIVFPLSIIC